MLHSEYCSHGVKPLPVLGCCAQCREKRMMQAYQAIFCCFVEKVILLLLSGNEMMDMCLVCKYIAHVSLKNSSSNASFMFDTLTGSNAHVSSLRSPFVCVIFNRDRNITHSYRCTNLISLNAMCLTDWGLTSLPRLKIFPPCCLE